MGHLVEDNLKTVKEQMQWACQASGRKIEEVKLLLATKTVPIEKLQIALQAGETLFGENKVQELRYKSIQLQIKEQKLPRVDMDILSMGMSGDFKVAIEEGATIIRVGTSVFGQRYLPDSYYWNEKARQED
ncbi:hypothetical protein D3C73_537330 [compost metagenome]